MGPVSAITGPLQQAAEVAEHVTNPPTPYTPLCCLKRRKYKPAYVHAWDRSRKTLTTANETDRVRFRNSVLLMLAASEFYAGLLTQSQTEVREVMDRID